MNQMHDLRTYGEAYALLLSATFLRVPTASEERREKGAEVRPSFKSAVAEGIQVGSRMSAALSRA